MTQQRLSCTAWLFLFLASCTPTQGKERKLPFGNQDPITTLQRRYKTLFIHKDRYLPPNGLSDSDPAFRSLHDLEKEKRLVQWFVRKHRADLRNLARIEIIYRSVLVIIGAVAFVLLLGTMYLSVFKTLLNNALQIKPESGLGRFINFLEGWLKKVDVLSWLLSSANLDQSQQALQSNNRNLASLVVIYHAMTYLNIPMVWLGKQISYVWELREFLQDPYYNPKVFKIELSYVQNLYLFDERQRHLIENLLMSIHADDTLPLQEVQHLIQTLKALPKGAKPVVYDQDAIDRALDGFPPHIKEIAENIIAMLVLYAEAIFHGKQDLLQKFPIKPILLLGGPGTGKSHLIKKIAEATRLQMTHVNLAREMGKEFKGESGYKHLLGLPGAYVDALRRSSNAWGRNYQNNLLVFGDIAAYFDDPMAVEYLKTLLDTQVTTIEDAYLGVPVFKLPFIFATSTNLPQDPELRDRFMIIKLQVPKDNKKRIMGRLLHTWTSFLSDPALQDHYEDSVREEELHAYLTHKAQAFIDEKDNTRGMRNAQEQVLQEIMAIVKQKVKQKSERDKAQALAEHAAS